MPLRIAVIGGSLSGLMCGIALRSAGHDVTIIEKEGDERQSHMAGVCLGLDAAEFLRRYDRIAKPFSHESRKVQAVKDDGVVQVFVNARRDITSWDTFYFRLRSCFDGYTSSYYPDKPQSCLTDGAARYESLTEVLAIEPADETESSQMILTLQDKKTGEAYREIADLVVAADGPDSLIRRNYLPQSQRQYVGYIAWRGTVPEKEMSKSAMEVFTQNISIHMMRREHCIAYLIPGPEGNCEPGERLLNFLWYTNESIGSLESIRIGNDGRWHHNIVPSGNVRQDVWDGLLEHAQDVRLPEPFLEVLLKIQLPFIQVITEFISPRACFENGRVLLVGDALSLYRPHTAFSATQAAFHSLCVDDYVGGRKSLQEYEENVSRYAHLHMTQSTWYGSFYQHHIVIALLAGLRYWSYCLLDKVKAWWLDEKPLLRSTMPLEEG